MFVLIEVIFVVWRVIVEEFEVFNVIVEFRMVVKKDGLVVIDNGNFILDVKFVCIEDLFDFEIEFNIIFGVVENGIFVDIVDIIFVGILEGVKRMER